MTETLFLIVTILSLAVGFFIAKWWFEKSSTKSEVQAQVLLERIKTVAKLVAVEGYFSEMYDYKDYKFYDLSFLRKKVLLRVRAKVSVGFDMQKMTIQARADRKTLYLSDLPAPEIISIEDTLDYYDISEGSFNSFKSEDYNKIIAEAKKFIREKAKESELANIADVQGQKILEFIKNMAEGMGWKVVMPQQLKLKESSKGLTIEN
jgi:hypothetical protein